MAESIRSVHPIHRVTDPETIRLPLVLRRLPASGSALLWVLLAAALVGAWTRVDVPSAAVGAGRDWLAAGARAWTAEAPAAPVREQAAVTRPELGPEWRFERETVRFEHMYRQRR